MSVTQLNVNDADLHRGVCLRCGSTLPDGAAFCAVCGERLDGEHFLTNLLDQEADMASRYRFTSLARKRPFVNLYFASDFEQTARQGQARMVAIRDIDCTSLGDTALVKAVKAVQQEYDLLRRSDIPYLTLATDLCYAQGHLFVVANQPPEAPSLAGSPGMSGGGMRDEQSGRLTTLQDYLQSGQGLPTEQRALEWIAQLCEAAHGLHQRQVVIGDLDPFAILYGGVMSDPGAAYLSLLIAWLPPVLRDMLPVSSELTNSFFSYFVAPEVAQGWVDARSDVYSLGAILYLLLTGMPPGETTLRNRGRQALLRAPHEINGQVSAHSSECVMQALALSPSQRFDSAMDFAMALRDPRYRRPLKSAADDDEDEEGGDVETVRIFPLSWKDIERWRAAHRRATPETPALSLDEALAVEDTLDIGQDDDVENQQEEADLVDFSPESSLPHAPTMVQSERANAADWKQRITGILPAISTTMTQTRRVLQAPNAQTGRLLRLAQGRSRWINLLKQSLLGQQQQIILAAAIVETPLRVLPDQMYSLRIHVMGRNDLGQTGRSRPAEGGISLSRMVHGDTVLIEVRSVLQQSYAYIVQRASVTIPAEGYVAEVTIPMQSLSTTPVGRRDRLHIFFLDEQRHPLYEKPFAVEIFVSHHVKRGDEGHHVLTIPF